MNQFVRLRDSCCEGHDDGSGCTCKLMSETCDSINPGDFVKSGNYAGVVDTVYISSSLVLIKTYDGIRPVAEVFNIKDVTKITREEMIAWKKKRKTSYPELPPEPKKEYDTPQQIAKIQCAMKEIRERDESSNETANFTTNEEFDLWLAQKLHTKLKEKGLL